jgi:protein-tyrosine phosphatase
MIPLADMHCHLLAGLDDGPRTLADAVTMCRTAYDEGVRLMAAGAHQNDHWPDVTPQRIRAATDTLRDELRRVGVPVSIFPCAEVMARPHLEAAWLGGELLSVADRGQYLLVEMPHGLFVDLTSSVCKLREAGVSVILAHPERCPEFLHEPGVLEALIDLGCLVQVSSSSVTDPRSPVDERALRDWFRRGCVHLMGSDGHSPRRRPPRLAGAYRQVCRWAGAAVADRVFSIHGAAAAHGLPLHIPAPQPRRVRWFARFW